MFNEVCAACHGDTAAAGPRAPSLLADNWLHGSDDESIARNIRDGFPDKGMVPFKDSLTDQQIWQMVAYLRRRPPASKTSRSTCPIPTGRSSRPRSRRSGWRSSRATSRRRGALAFLPDGRLLITERPGRLRIVENGKLLPDAVKGTPKVWEKQDGGLLDVEVHPQYARNGWIYLSYSETLPGTSRPPDRPRRRARPPIRRR